MPTYVLNCQKDIGTYMIISFMRNVKMSWENKLTSAHVRAYIKRMGMQDCLGSLIHTTLNVCCLLLVATKVICFLRIVSFLLSLRTKITLWNSSWMPLSYWEGQLCLCVTLWFDCQQMVCPWMCHINHSILSRTNSVSLFETCRLLKLPRLLR